MPTLLTRISEAACDGMRTGCALLSELPDRKMCNTSVTYVPPVTRTFIRRYTPSPDLAFIGGNCSGASARFFEPTESDPTSATAPHWKLVHTSTFNETEDGTCVLGHAPTTDRLLAVFDLRLGNSSLGLVFSRTATSNTTTYFDLVDPRGEWMGTHARLSFEVDDRYVFPGCCVLPLNLTDTEGRLWRQSAQESVCDIVDSAEYVYEGLAPTLISTHNLSHERWSFDVSIPKCGGLLTEAFSVSVHVPLEEQHTAPPAPSMLSYEEVKADSPWFVYVTVAVIFLTVLIGSACLKTDLRRKMLKKLHLM